MPQHKEKNQTASTNNVKNRRISQNEMMVVNIAKIYSLETLVCFFSFGAGVAVDGVAGIFLTFFGGGCTSSSVSSSSSSSSSSSDDSSLLDSTADVPELEVSVGTGTDTGSGAGAGVALTAGLRSFFDWNLA